MQCLSFSPLLLLPLPKVNGWLWLAPSGDDGAFRRGLVESERGLTNVWLENVHALIVLGSRIDV